MKETDREWIDAATYEQLLQRWRHGDMGDLIFQGSAGSYYVKVMQTKAQALTPEERAEISKRIGW